MRERLRDLGISVPEIYLPREGIDYRKWAVIACDQYSSEREYWEDVAREVNDAPSTLRLIFPECFLEDSDIDQRILGSLCAGGTDDMLARKAQTWTYCGNRSGTISV